MQGYDDAGAHWKRLPEPLRHLVDEYNRMPEAAKAAVRDTPEKIKALLDQRGKSRGQIRSEPVHDLRRRSARKAR